MSRRRGTRAFRLCEEPKGVDRTRLSRRDVVKRGVGLGMGAAMASTPFAQAGAAARIQPDPQTLTVASIGLLTSR